MSDCGAPLDAKTIFNDLISGSDFNLPVIDFNSDDFKFPSKDGNPLYGVVDKIGIDQLTTKVIGGTGVFDSLMTAISAHLQDQYEKGRITGREYTESYTAAIQAAMQQAVGFLMGKDQAYWSALLVQAQARRAEIEAVTARIALENTKMEYAFAKANALSAQAEYTVKLMQLPLADQDLCLKKEQKRNLELDKDTKSFTLDNLLPEQHKLLKEQVESTRAQTMDVRLDGAPVVGVLGKQKELYDQQITSYQRDAEVKAAKMFLDSWITQKTIDEGLLAPTALQNESINTVMNRVKTQNGLNI